MLISSFAQAQSGSMTALQVVEKIKQQVSPKWTETKTDTIVMGSGNDVVTGIATCMFLDMDILRRAVAAHCNMIITHEPAFYTGKKPPEDFMKSDSVRQEKIAFIKANNLVIFWFHDNAHFSKPDHIMQGLANDLGWKTVNTRPTILELKKDRLKHVASYIKDRLKLEGVRVIGDPEMEVSRIGLVPGLAPTLEMHLGVLGRNDVDAVLVGEAREWEDYLYTRDAVLQGRKKAAIFIGHLRSEESGSKYTAEWLKTFIKQIPVTFLRNGDYWWIAK